MTPQMAHQDKGHPAHRNPEDQQPANKRDHEDQWPHEKVEENEENNPPHGPLATAKQTTFGLWELVIFGLAASLGSAQKTVLFARGIHAVSPASNERTISAGTKEEPSVLQIAILPLFIFADAAALAFIFFSIMLIRLEKNE